MMRVLPLFLTALLVGAGPAFAAAPPKAPTKPAPVAPKPAGLTLAQAVSTALASQPQLRQAQAELGVSKAGVDLAGASLRPQIGFTTSYLFGPSRQNANQVGVPVTNLGNYSLGLSFDQLVYDFGQAGNRRESAEAQYAAQAQTTRQTTLSVVQSVRAAFFAARAGQTLVQVAQETLANQLRHQSQTRSLVEIGTRPPIDLAQTSADVANARLQLINAQNTFETAKAQLNQAMGVERGTDYAIADETMAAVAGEDSGLDPLLKEAIANRPDLAAMAARIQAQEFSLDAAEKANYPTLRASAGAGANGTPITAPSNNWSAGLGLSWPLYSGGGREAQAEQARSNLESLKAQADTMRQQVRLTVEQARLGVVAAKAALQSAGEATRAARTRLTLAEGRYSAGVGSALELGDAQLAYTNARAQEVQETFRLSTARAQLLLALGRQ